MCDCRLIFFSFSAQLEKERQLRHQASRRAQSAVPLTVSSRSQTTTQPTSTAPPPATTRPLSAHPSQNSSAHILQSRAVRFPPNDAQQLQVSSQQSSAHPAGITPANYLVKKRTKTTCTKAFVFETPDNYTIPVKSFLHFVTVVFGCCRCCCRRCRCCFVVILVLVVLVVIIIVIIGMILI